MGWLDANEYFLMEMAGRDRVEEFAQTAHLVRTAADRHDGADVTPYEMCRRAPRFAGRLMCFLSARDSGTPSPRPLPLRGLGSGKRGGDAVAHRLVG
jgi:hypothetical protein